MPGSLADRPHASNVVLGLTYAAITLLFVVLAVYACSGPRGSDQFWYLNDVLTLMSGDPPLTNTIYPGPLLREQIPIKEFYFIHHTLVLYLVLPFAKCLGAYHGWIALNVVSALATAALIAAALQLLTTRWLALMGYGVFLLLPLTLWQTCNVLQEVVFCTITAVLTVLYVVADRSLVYWVALLACSGVAVLCQPLFLPVACVLPLVLLWQKRHAWKVGHFILAGSALGVVALLQLVKAKWFLSTFPPSLTGILQGVIPGGGNMEWHLRTDLPSMTLGMMLSKVWLAVTSQFALSPSAVFFWPADAMLLGSALLIGYRKKDPRIARLLSATWVFVGLVAAMVCCHTNQFRSSLMITPAILLSTAVYAHHAANSLTRRRLAVGFLATALVGFLVLDLSIARHLRREGKEATAAIESIRRRTQPLRDDQRVVIEVESSSEPLMLAYALRPRKCLILKRGYQSPETIQQLLDTFGPTMIFCRPESNLPQQAGAIRAEANWPGRYSEFEAYDVR